jgi:predicted small lipoprotein YifL
MPLILTASRRTLLGLMLAVLAGCGLKGDLVLPDQGSDPRDDAIERERDDD